MAPAGQLPDLHVSAHHRSVAPAFVAVQAKLARWPHWHMLSGQLPVEQVRTHLVRVRVRVRVGVRVRVRVGVMVRVGVRVWG